MGTVLKNYSDEDVMKTLSMQFSFLVGDTFPKSKPSTKNDASITKEEWFKELSFIHMFAFCQAFHEATARNLMNAFEAKAARELYDML